MPRVGQRGRTPAGASNCVIGKFESMPPSTSHVGRPSESFQPTGRKKNGIDIEIRTASTIRCSPGERW